MTFCLRDKAMIDYSYFPQMAPTDDAEKITSEPHGSNTLDTRLAQHKKRPYREYRYGTGQKPSEG